MTEAQSAAAAAFERQRAAMGVEGCTPPEMHVLLVLCVMANEVAQCWPAIRGANGLVAKTGLGERTIARALRALETNGHVSTRRVDGKGSIYTVHPCHSGTPATAAGVTERQGTPATAATKQPMNNHRKKKASPSPYTRTASASGTRLDPELEPPPDWIAWACTERGWDEATATDELATFRDYWIAQPGAKGRKADWPATWRNWVRRSRRPDTMKDHQHGRRGQPVPAGGGARGSRPDPALDLRRIALAELEAEERATADQAARGGPWLALPPERGG